MSSPKWVTIQTTAQALDMTVDDAAIWKWRLQALKRVAESYGVVRADEPESAQVMDLLI